MTKPSAHRKLLFFPARGFGREEISDNNIFQLCLSFRLSWPVIRRKTSIYIILHLIFLVSSSMIMINYQKAVCNPLAYRARMAERSIGCLSRFWNIYHVFFIQMSFKIFMYSYCLSRWLKIYFNVFFLSQRCFWIFMYSYCPAFIIIFLYFYIFYANIILNFHAFILSSIYKSEIYSFNPNMVLNLQAFIFCIIYLKYL